MQQMMVGGAGLQASKR